VLFADRFRHASRVTVITTITFVTVKSGQSVKSANRLTGEMGSPISSASKSSFQSKPVHAKTSGLAPAAVETEAVAAWGFARRVPESKFP